MRVTSILGEVSNVVHESDVFKLFRLVDSMPDAEGFSRTCQVLQ
jgi:hypothetical protein